jgi:hypothetical protein
MTEPYAHALLLLHLTATLFMAGVIWFVQVVHYPLLARVGPGDAPGYERTHTRLTAWVVGPPMLAELATGILLLWVRPAGVTVWTAGAGVALLGVIWLSTQFVQVPCHERLSRAFDPAVHRRLVASNWVRTAAWSLRGLLVLGMVWTALP